MRLAIRAVVIGSIPLIATVAFILDGHFTNATTSVNWAECALACIAVGAVWWVRQKRKGHQTF